jgi:SNF2 family DNA or RNA helicase
MKLFSHQVTGAHWMAARAKALLGDTPGLGKTYTAIQALIEKNVVNPLIVCPAIARTHWHRSFAAMGWAAPYEVASFEKITQEGTPGMAGRIYGKNRIDSLVIDEFHYGKNASSQRAQILLGNNGYARRVEHVLGLSGSIPKHPGEFFNVLVCMFPQVLIKAGVATRERFMDRFTIRKGRVVRGHWVEKVVEQRNTSELRAILNECMIKRDVAELGLDVPSVWWQTIVLDGEVGGETFAEWERYMTREASAKTLEEIAADPHVARMRRRLGELKAPLVVEMLKQQLAGNDEKVVVFAHHRSVLETLRVGLADFGVAYVDGDTAESTRNCEIDSFQAHPSYRVFIGQNIACRYSITLTAAHRAILVEPDWSADTNFQLGQRIARIGSTASHCVGQMIALAGTLDEAIVRQTERETRMAADLFSKEDV